MKTAVKVLSIINIVICSLMFVPFIIMAIDFCINENILNILYSIIFGIFGALFIPSIFVSSYTLFKIHRAKEKQEMMLSAILNLILCDFAVGIILLLMKEENFSETKIIK